MIVYNTGYLKKSDVEALLEQGIQFGIYKTPKGTQILVKSRYSIQKRIHLSQPKHDRLPYKVIEGKKITSGELIFDSIIDVDSGLDTSGWNNGNQIMSYEDYYFKNFNKEYGF